MKPLGLKVSTEKESYYYNDGFCTIVDNKEFSDLFINLIFDLNRDTSGDFPEDSPELYVFPCKLPDVTSINIDVDRDLNLATIIEVDENGKEKEVVVASLYGGMDCADREDSAILDELITTGDFYHLKQICSLEGIPELDGYGRVKRIIEHLVQSNIIPRIVCIDKPCRITEIVDNSSGYLCNDGIREIVNTYINAATGHPVELRKGRNWIEMYQQGLGRTDISETWLGRGMYNFIRVFPRVYHEIFINKNIVLLDDLLNPSSVLPALHPLAREGVFYPFHPDNFKPDYPSLFINTYPWIFDNPSKGFKESEVIRKSKKLQSVEI